MKVDWARYQLRVTKVGLKVSAIPATLGLFILVGGLASPYLRAKFGWQLGSFDDHPMMWFGVAGALVTALFTLWRYGWSED